MNAAWIAIVAILALATVYVLIPVASDSYLRYRRRRVVTCPESGALVEICADARRAAFSSLFGKSRLKVKTCTRWPERKGCNQSCLAGL